MKLFNKNSKEVKVEGIDLENIDLTTTDYTKKSNESHFQLLIGGEGNVKLTTLAGTTITVTLPAGYNPIACTKVFKTDTTATGLVAIY